MIYNQYDLSLMNLLILALLKIGKYGYIEKNIISYAVDPWDLFAGLSGGICWP